MNQTFDTKWPIVNYDRNDQPHFLFIITLPYSGSTALAQLINSSSRTMVLHEKGEGQWLIPGLCDNQRWQPDKKINHESIQSIWLNKYQATNKLVQNIEVIIEKSPPNMIRIKELASIFKKHSFLANNRNPYAQCASMLYRTCNPHKLSEHNRATTVKDLASKWIIRSSILKSLITNMSIPLITYEEFCKKPASIKDLLVIPESAINTIQDKALVKVKDYKPQKIINQNDRQISNLTIDDIDNISQILSKHKKLLRFYNYEIITN